MNEQFLADTNDDTIRFPSFMSLRSAHAELLQGDGVPMDSPAHIESINDFLVRGQATGALLDSSLERRAAQSLLNYWATILYRNNVEPPDTTLAEFDPLLAPELDDSLCPYVGLDTFRESNQNIFFGREQLVVQLVAKLSADPILTVLGASGSGKSSLVRAGLLPALKGDGLAGSGAWIYPRPMVPGSNPLVNLANILAVGDIPVEIDRFYSDSDYLHKLVTDHFSSPVVLMIDQFEEVFTLCTDDDVRRAFISNLIGLITSAGDGHKLILTMRTDFESQIPRLPGFQELFEKNVIRVIPLGPKELRDAIESPASLIGLKFEEGLVDALVQDVLGEEAALPLLQFTLLKLWERRQRNRVTWETYRKLGGGRQALANAADEFYDSLIPEEQVTTRRILLKLVRPGEGKEVTSNRIRRAALYLKGEASDRIDRVLGKLLHARLLRQSEGDTDADDQIEIAHEALIRNWPRLVGWLEDERVTLYQRARLTSAAEQWLRLGKDPSALRRGVLLQESLHYDDLNDLESEFVQASQELEQSEQTAKLLAQEQALKAEVAQKLAEAEKQRAEEQTQAAARLRARNRVITWIGGFALLTALIAIGLGNQSSGNADLARRNESMALTASAQLINEQATAESIRAVADEQTKLAYSRGLAAQANNLMESQPDLGTLLSLESLRIQDTFEARSSVLSGLQVDPNLFAFLRGHTGPIRGVAFSPDGKLLASASEDDSVIIWNVGEDHYTNRVSTDCGCDVTSVVFNPGGDLLAAGTHNKVIILSHFDSDSPERQELETDDWINSVQFSPDGSSLAAGSRNGEVIVWNVGSSEWGKQILAQVATSVNAVAYSPDGRILAAAGEDGSVTLWDVETQEPARDPIIREDEHNARTLAFSLDGKYLAVGYEDSLVRLHDAANWDFIRDLPMRSSVNAIAFSPNSKELFAASGDGEITRWTVENGEAVGESLTGHLGGIRSLAVNPAGTLLASGGNDSNVIIWKPQAGLRIQQNLHHDNDILSVAFTPKTSGPSLFTGSWQKIILWDLKENPALSTALEPTHHDFIFSLAVSRDGKWMASSSCTAREDGKCKQGEIYIWDASPVVPVRTHELIAHDGYVDGLAFSPDGTILATGSWDENVFLWDVQSGQQLGTLTDPESTVYSLDFSPDGKYLAAGTYNDIYIWDVQTHELLNKFTGNGGWVFAMKFSPDGKWLAAGGGDQVVRLWNVSRILVSQVESSDVESDRSLIGHKAAIYSLAFSPDSTKIVTGGRDGLVFLWDINTATKIGRNFIGPGPLEGVDFSSNGKFLAAGSGDSHDAFVWNIDLPVLKEEACARAGRNLTQEEWNIYIGSYTGNESYSKTCPQWP